MHERFNRALIALSLAGFTPAPSFVTSIEGDDKGGGGGGGKGEGDNKSQGPPPDEKKFTQADLDRVIEQRTARWSKETDSKVSEAIKAESTKAAKLQAEFDELKAKLEDANKTEPQKEVARLSRELAKASQALEDSKKSIESLTGERDGATTKLQQHIIKGHLRDALTASKVAPKYAAAALKLFADDVKIELDEEGNVASVAIGKRSYDDVAKAAAAWLEVNDNFAAHPGGGTGTRTGGGPKNGVLDDDDMNPEALLSRGFAAQRRAG